MKAEELRLNNYVLIKGEKFDDEYIHFINAINDDMCAIKCNEESDVYHNSEIEPIPLTRELLKLLGFKTQNSTLYYWLSLSNLKAELHCEIYEKENVFIIKSDFANLILDPIKYVHQLQNLYFALTNTELIFTNDEAK